MRFDRIFLSFMIIYFYVCVMLNPNRSLDHKMYSFYYYGIVS